MRSERKSVLVFTGLSIPFHEARRILSDAEFKPPVRRGDVLAAVERRYEIIGIIDGVFMTDAAVAHREILSALSEGITVVGGASMGALRASELDEYGMIGVGEIYRWYKEGVIDSDDEVAVIFDPETLKPLSEPLVNIRYNLKLMCNASIISESEREMLLEMAKGMFYPRRNWQRLLKEASKRLGNEKVRRIHAFLKEKGVDLKRKDAIEVLKKIRELINA